MVLKNKKQVKSKKTLVVDNEIKLISYYEDFETTLKWYQDLQTVKQCDNSDKPYDIELLKKMYDYLNSNGDLYYIKYGKKIIGDVTLEYNKDIAIVISHEYQNKHIGRKVLKRIIEEAKIKGYDYIHANIYSFNIQSQKMFLSIGFVKKGDEDYIIHYKNSLIYHIRNYSLTYLDFICKIKEANF